MMMPGGAKLLEIIESHNTGAVKLQSSLITNSNKTGTCLDWHRSIFFLLILKKNHLTLDQSKYTSSSTSNSNKTGAFVWF
jgi:hypothetical protein